MVAAPQGAEGTFRQNPYPESKGIETHPTANRPGKVAVRQNPYPESKGIETPLWNPGRGDGPWVRIHTPNRRGLRLGHGPGRMCVRAGRRQNPYPESKGIETSSGSSSGSSASPSESIPRIEGD